MTDSPVPFQAPEIQTWVITDGRMGNVRQAQALADALRFDSQAHVLKLERPWRWFAPRLTRFAQWALPQSLLPLTPDQNTTRLVIGCGRAAAFATRALREMAPDKVFSIQILDPRIDPSHWNLVIAPLHDDLRGENVLNTLGALNNVDEKWLVDAANQFAYLRDLPQPRTAVLIGGSNSAQKIDALYIEGLLDQLREWQAASGGSLMLTTSARSGAQLGELIRTRLKNFPHKLWCGEHDGVNPYAGFLAYAQRIVVTPDSVNLISEACATGKPVFCFAPQSIRGKLRSLHQELKRSGRMQNLRSSELASSTMTEPLRETEAIAALVREHFAHWMRTRAQT